MNINVYGVKQHANHCFVTPDSEKLGDPYFGRDPKVDKNCFRVTSNPTYQKQPKNNGNIHDSI